MNTCHGCNVAFGMWWEGKSKCQGCNEVFCTKCYVKASNRCKACDDVKKKAEVEATQLPSSPEFRQGDVKVESPHESLAAKALKTVFGWGDKNAKLVAPDVSFTPIHQPMCQDLFLDCTIPADRSREEYMQDFVTNVPKRKETETDEGYAHTFQRSFGILSRTRSMLYQLHDAATRRHIDEALTYAAGLLPPALEYVDKLLLLDDLSRKSKLDDDFAQAFKEVIEYAHSKITNMQEGTAVTLPVFWRESGHASPQEEASLAFIVFHRHTSATYQIAVANMSAGAKRYHGMAFDGKTENASEPLYHMPYVPPQVVDINLVTRSWLYYVFILPLVYKSYGSHGAAYVYECLVPAMTKVHASHKYRGQGTWKQHLPIGGDRSYVLTTVAAMRWAAAMHKGDAAGEALEVSIREAILSSLVGSVKTPSEIYALRQCLMHTAKRCSGPTLHSGILELNKLLEDREAAPPETAAARAASLLPAALELSHVGATEVASYFKHRGFETLNRCSYDLEALAGKAEKPRILLPITTVHIRDTVATPADCVHVLKETLTAVNMYTAQHQQIQNHALLSLALFQQVFLCVIPLPRCTDTKSCFWRPDELRYETQQTLLRQLSDLSACFAAVAFSLEGRELDGSRIIVANAIMVLVDFLCRAKPTDCVPENGSMESVFSQHYSGDMECFAGAGVGVPIARYVPYTEAFVKRTEDIMLHSPDLAAKRTEILDYWHHLCADVPEAHVLFRFDDMKLTTAEEDFVTQLSLACGRGGDDVRAAQALAGTDPWLSGVCPEVEILRDVTFLTQLMVSERCDSLPACNPKYPYKASDAKLTWRAREGNRNPSTGALEPGQADKLEATGFRRSLALNKKPEKAPTGLRHKVVSFLSRIKQEELRNVSRASPAALVGDQSVVTEEDVLYVKQPPTFNGAIGKQHSETLLTFLTAPNLRIVTLLTWFGSQDHIHCLADKELQMVLDSALFEPGPWAPPGDAPEPDVVPAPTRDHLRTPCGLLFDELLKSPSRSIDACLVLMRHASERCTDKYAGPHAELMLYVTRVVCRVRRYLEYLITAVGGEGEVGGITRGLGKGCLAAGVTVEDLMKHSADVKEELEGSVYVRLNRWVRKAEKDSTVERACLLHAHIALIYQGYGVEDFKKKVEAAKAIMAAQLYLTTYHSWARTGLGVSEVELCDAFEKVRRPLFKAMQQDASVREKALESGKWAATSSRPADEASYVYGKRWRESVFLRGVFEDCSTQEADPREAARARLAPREGETYVEWLRRTTNTNEYLYINMNNGTCSQNKDDIGRVPDEVYRDPDFSELFGGLMRCSRLGRSVSRVMERLLGTEDGEYNLHLWYNDERKNPAVSALQSIGWLDTSSSWDVRCPTWAREHIRHELSAGGLMDLLQVDLRYITHGDGWCSLGCIRKVDNSQYAMNVVVRKDPPVTHVFQITECGRRYYRRQIYTTDTVHSYHSPHDDGGEVASSRQSYYKYRNEWTLSGGSMDDLHQPETSVQLFKVSDTNDENWKRRMYLPKRLLQGVLPDALLEQYRFWQDADDTASSNIIGRPTAKEDTTSLDIELDFGPSLGLSSGTITRIQHTPDGKEVRWTLMNLLDPEEGAEKQLASRLAGVFTRLDNLSHILVWCDDSGLAKVELPRLRLSFTKKGARLHCDQHSGYYLHEGKTDKLTSELVSQLGGGSVLLEKETGELASLASRIAEPLRPSSGTMPQDKPLSWVDRRLPYQLLFRRAEPEVMKALSSGARHHFYPIHHSHTFLKTPTTAATLYLMLCLTLRRRYALVVEMGSRLAEVSGEEEKQLLMRVVSALSEDKDTPDAVACRLRLMESMGACCNPWIFAKDGGWSLDVEMANYVLRRRGISCDLLLTAEEEADRLGDLADRTPRLDNRFMALRCMIRKGEAVKGKVGEVWQAPERESYDCLKIEAGSELKAAVTSIAYSEQESSPKQGLDSLKKMNELMRSSAGISVLLIYEIFTGTYTPMILGNVDGNGAVVLGGLLTRLVYFTTKVNVSQVLRWLISLEKTLALSPDKAITLPKLPSADEVKIAENEGSGLFKRTVSAAEARIRLRCSRIVEAVTKHSEMLKTTNVSTGLVGRRLQGLRELGESTLDTAYLPYQYSGDMTGLHTIQPWKVLPYITDTTALQAPGKGYPHLQSPLEELRELVVMKDEVLNSELSVFADKLRELNIDGMDKVVRSIEERQKQRRCAPCMGSLNDESLRELDRRLAAIKEKDNAVAERLEADIMSAVNPLSEEVARIGGTKTTYHMSAVVRLYLSKEAEFLSEETRDMVTHWLSVQCRRAQTQSCILALKALQHLPNAEGVPGAGEDLAKQLIAERHHVDPEGRVDPRYLVFEFTNSILMRKEQVSLLKKICGSEKPTVHQMIMGQGKTTVLTPLLALAMGEGRDRATGDREGRLVVVCMPRALVEFSKSVLLDSFSSPVLPKAVLSIDFQRTSVMNEGLLKKLVKGVDERSVVVIHPATVKSLLLKHVLLFERLDFDAREREGHAAHESTQGALSKLKNNFVSMMVGGKQVGLAKQEELSINSELSWSSKVLGLLETKVVMVMDEVDMLLHPLRSELNWPLGVKHPIDLTASRTKEDARFEGVRYKLVWFLFELTFAHNANDRHELSMLQEAQPIYLDLKTAILAGYSSGALQRTPHLVILDKTFYVEKMRGPFTRLTRMWLQKYVCGVDKESIERYITEGKGNFTCGSDADAKLLNLAHSWVTTYLPHCLMKVHRVAFGCLRADELRASLEADPRMARSRQLLAVPFVGKDAPSESSEFQHPDMAIGLTVHSVMQDGLRPVDLVEVISDLRARYDNEEKRPVQTRDAARKYVEWLKDAGARVKGYSWDGVYLRGKHQDTSEERTVSWEETADERQQRSELWQLGLVSPADTEQMEILGKYLLRSKGVARDFLVNCAFQEVLSKAVQQLSASGQELASSLLSSHRVAFSGTPNDLLPDGIGKCEYAEGDDGEMVNTLSAAAVVTVETIDRNPHELLKKVATAVNADGSPMYTAMIDTGALITGMSNREVAERLFAYNLQQRGVVYLDDEGRRTVLLKGSQGKFRDVPLEQSGLPLAERFTFYDHIHTTGMDIKQPKTCKASLTISQDMVFRDYAQGAYRMRDIGSQTLDVFVPRDVDKLIPQVFEDSRRMDLLMWLLRNGSRAEEGQLGLLQKQRMCHIWRKQAFGMLQQSTKPEERRHAVQLLKEQVSCKLRHTIRAENEPVETLREELLKLQDMYDNLIKLGDRDAERVNELIRSVKRSANVAGDLERGQVSEAEAEQSQQQQQHTVKQAEEEVDMNVENEDEQEAVPEIPDDLDWDRTKVPVVRWKVASLTEPAGLFYELSAKSMNGNSLTYPSFLRCSENFIPKPGFVTKGPKRLKNVYAYLEVLPTPREMINMEDIPLDKSHRIQLRTTFDLYTEQGGDFISKSRLRALLKEMELQVQDTALEGVEDPVSFDSFATLVSSMENLMLFKNRYMIAVSLEEAEHVRALMQRGTMQKIPMALRVVHMKHCLGTTLLQATAAYEELGDLPSNQVGATEACLGYLNCEGSMPKVDLLWVLRLLKNTQPDVRRKYYLHNRSLRRRKRIPWVQQPIAMVLIEEAEFAMLQTNAVVSKFKVAMMADSDICTEDKLFECLDVTQKGQLSKEDVLAGVRWLGLNRGQTDAAWSASVSRLFEQLGVGDNGEKVLTIEVVRKHFRISDEEREELAKLCGGVVQREKATERPVHRKDEAQPSSPSLPAEIPDVMDTGTFRIDAVHPTQWVQVWNSTGTACDKPVSVWRAEGKAARNAKLIRFGDYLRPSLNMPNRTDKCRDLGSHEVRLKPLPCKLWQVTDNDKWSMMASPELDKNVDKYFPHPVRYSLVWELQVKKPLFLWEPQPPSKDFVSAGLVVTTTPEPPSREYVRCLPAKWCLGDSETSDQNRMVVWKERSQSVVQLAVDPSLGLCSIADIKACDLRSCITDIRQAPAPVAVVSKYRRYPNTKRIWFS